MIITNRFYLQYTPRPHAAALCLLASALTLRFAALLVLWLLTIFVNVTRSLCTHPFPVSHHSMTSAAAFAAFDAASSAISFSASAA